MPACARSPTRACVRTGAGTRVCVFVCAPPRARALLLLLRERAPPRGGPATGGVAVVMETAPRGRGGRRGRSGGRSSGGGGGGGGGRCSAQRCAPGPRPPPGRAATRRGTEAVGAERSGRTWCRYRGGDVCLSVCLSARSPIPPPLPPASPGIPSLYPLLPPSRSVPLTSAFPGALPCIVHLHPFPFHLSTSPPPIPLCFTHFLSFPPVPTDPLVSSSPSPLCAVPRPGARSCEPIAPGPARPPEGERCGRCSGGGAAEEQRTVRPRGLCAFLSGSFKEGAVRGGGEG